MPISDVSLPGPRLRPPESLTEFCRVDDYDRALHAYGRSYRDIVRAFRGRFDHLPDVVAHPRDERELQAALDWALSAGAAVIPFGGGTSVVGGVEAAGCEDHAGVVTLDLKSLDEVLEIDPVSLSARIQAGATGPRLEDSFQDTALRSGTSPSRFSSRPSAAGSRPAPAATSPRSTPTSTTSSSRCARSRRRACGSRGGCPPQAPASRLTAC